MRRDSGGRFDDSFFLCRRMLKFYLAGIKRDLFFGQEVRTAVLLVAQYGIPHKRQLRTDLVKPARSQSDFQL